MVKIVLLLACYYQLLSFASVSCQDYCLRNSSNVIRTSPDAEENDGFGALLSVARQFRESFFSLTSLNYDRLRKDINEIYIGSRSFSDVAFIETAIYYCTDALFLAVLVIGTSIIIPTVVFCMWCCWMKCYDAESEEIVLDDPPNKHLSLAAQFISWILGSAIVLMLLFLLAFAIILIIGNERVGVAVTGSSNAIRETLPTIQKIHQQFLSTVNDTLAVKYRELNESIYLNELTLDTGELSDGINSTLLFNNLNSISINVTHTFSDVDSVHKRYSDIFAVNSYISFLNLSSIINSLHDDLDSLRELCNGTMMNVSYPPCANLTDESYPILSTNLLSDSVASNTLNKSYQEFKDNCSTVFNSNLINAYNDFLLEIESNISDIIFNRTNILLVPLNMNVSSAVDSIFNQFGPITYGLPSSQDLVISTLDDNYLSNWQEFRSLATIAFSLSFVVFSVGVVLAIVRGVINALAIYLYNDELEYKAKAHLAAKMLNSLAVWISIVGVVSAFFFIFVLCFASILGRGCGQHGNYSEIISDVIDNNVTWSGVYPLGLSYYNNSAHPLLLSSVILSCAKGQSAAEAIELTKLVNIFNLPLTSAEEAEYINDMIDIHTQVSFDGYSVLGLDTSESLESCRAAVSTTGDCVLCDYQLLQEDIFNDSFVGVNSLSHLLSDMLSDPLFNSTFSSAQQEYITDIIANLNSNVTLLVSADNRYKTLATEARSSATMIQQAYSRISTSSTQIAEDSDAFRNSLINVVDRVVENYALYVASNITSKTKDLLNSSAYAVYCNAGICSPVVRLFSNFTQTTCYQLLDGLDIYWASLLLILIISLLAVILIMLLACHFADREIFQRESSNSKLQPYYHSEQILSQSISFTWLVLVNGVDLWFVVAIATNDALNCDEQQTVCCTVCLWVIGLLFLVVAMVTTIALKVYEFVVLRRIRASRGVKVQQIQRYWLARFKAAIFFERLLLFFLLHIPFVAIAGSYITSNGMPTSPSFASLVFSLVSILMFLGALVVERGQLIEHLNLLHQAVNSICYKSTDKYTPTTNNSDLTGNGGVGVVRTTDNGIQLRAVNPEHALSESDHTYEYNEYNPEMELQERLELPTVRELSEQEMGEAINEAETMFIENDPPPPQAHMGLSLDPFNENEDEPLGGQNEGHLPTVDEQPINTILLDRHNEQRLNEPQRNRNGVRLAHSYLSQHTDGDGSTPRSSLYMSEDSVTGSELPPYYRSLSHVPGYTSTDDSSYRDEYDSYESDSYYGGGGQIDGKQVEV